MLFARVFSSGVEQKANELLIPRSMWVKNE